MKNKPEGYAHLTAKIDRLKNQLVEAKAEIVRLKGKAVAKERKPVPEFELIEKWEGE